MKINFKGFLFGGLQQYTTVDVTTELDSAVQNLQNHSEKDYKEIVSQAEGLVQNLYDNISTQVTRFIRKIQEECAITSNEANYFRELRHRQLNHVVGLKLSSTSAKYFTDQAMDDKLVLTQRGATLKRNLFGSLGQQ